MMCSETVNVARSGNCFKPAMGQTDFENADVLRDGKCMFELERKVCVCNPSSYLPSCMRIIKTKTAQRRVGAERGERWQMQLLEASLQI